MFHLEVCLCWPRGLLKQQTLVLGGQKGCGDGDHQYKNPGVGGIKGVIVEELSVGLELDDNPICVH